MELFFLLGKNNLNPYARVLNRWKEIACHEIYLVAKKHVLWTSGDLLQSWSSQSKGIQRHIQAPPSFGARERLYRPQS